MAKKKHSKKGKKSTSAPKHALPAGFWAQIFAVFLIVFGLLMAVAWFGAGGPFFVWVQDFMNRLMGMAVYVLPFLCVYLGIEIFRSDNNKLSALVKIGSFMLVTWFAGLFGLFRAQGAPSTGGIIGDGLNSVTLSLVNQPVAAIIYVLLIIMTTLFVAKVSPIVIIRAFWELVRTDKSEQDANVRVMKKVAEAEAKPAPIHDFNVNAGVPMLTAEERKKQARLSSLKNSVVHDKEAAEKAAMLAVSDPNWRPPSLDLLEKKQNPADAGDIQGNAHIIQNTLHEFNIDVEMEGANIGPKVTQYTLRPPAGIKLSKITALENNIALNLAASSLRMEAPIPGQRAVGIEVPNQKAADVRIRGILESASWTRNKEPLAFAIGKDIAGEPVVGELNKMPHLLIAGQTGSGKSVAINTLLCSLLYRNAPSDMKLILVDPKQVEMAPYADIPHLLTPVIVEPEKTISALKWSVNEMERRYSLLKEENVKDIASYNSKIKQHGKHIAVEDEDGHLQQVNEGTMPYIVIVIDELADLMMMAARDVEALIVRIAQKARAVGIHLVLATQRPSVDVITGLIKANIPARIAFTVASQVDSRTILDQIGAEKLLGQGDMLIKTATMPKPKRLQGAWVMDNEVTKITDHLRMQSRPQYNDDIVNQSVQLNIRGGGMISNGGGEANDAMFDDAVRVVIEARKASTSYLQRKLKVGYSRAARIIEEMEEQGIVGPADGSRPREVLVSSMTDLDALSSLPDEP